MIKADFLINPNGEIAGFRVEGHSGFAEEGADIICSAVSSAAYMAVNTITDVLHISPSTLVAEDGFMLVRIENSDMRISRDILEGFKIHLTNLEEQYKDYIKVGYMEV